MVAGSLLTFIPAVGDFINAEIIGASNPDSIMIGNVIQFKFINANDYPAAAAWRSCSSSGSCPGRGLHPGWWAAERLTEAGGRSDACRSIALPVFTALVVIFLFLPIAVMIIFSFNDPAGRQNITWQGSPSRTISRCGAAPTSPVRWS